MMSLFCLKDSSGGISHKKSKPTDAHEYHEQMSMFQISRNQSIMSNQIEMCTLQIKLTNMAAPLQTF